MKPFRPNKPGTPKPAVRAGLKGPEGNAGLVPNAPGVVKAVKGDRGAVPPLIAPPREFVEDCRPPERDDIADMF